MGKVPHAQACPLGIELVGQALDEEQAEDEFLEFGGIHLATQDIGRAHQERFELRQANFWVFQQVVLAWRISPGVHTGANRVPRIDHGIRMMPGREACASHKGMAARRSLIGALVSQMSLPFASHWSDRADKANG
ncbi:hypothetical protein [Rhodanobacter ginsenosidimutans]|uniref:Uncharacterized protein n=1 Tax=Rhodanobacter ginsenosidimutans TaxID=490571 RepID=A0ABW0JVP3_9GAMM